MGTEFECKLAVPDRTVLRAIADAFAPEAPAHTQQLETVYYDLRSLGRPGWMLRSRRTDGGAPVYTCKTPGEGYAHGEWECAAASPAEAAAALAADGAPAGLLALHEFRVLCGASFARTAILLVRAGAQIELALDDGFLYGPAGRAAVCEAELELKAGPAAPLLALRDELIARFGLTEAFESKSARAMALAGRTPGEETP